MLSRKKRFRALFFLLAVALLSTLVMAHPESGILQQSGAQIRFESKVAQQRPARPLEPSLETLAGNWEVNFNHARGRLRVSSDGEGWQARLFLNRTERWENIRDLDFDPVTGRVSFFRPEANQRFQGVFRGDRMAGTFQDDLKWTAQRRK